MHWLRAAPRAIMDTLPEHGAQPWEAGQVSPPPPSPPPPPHRARAAQVYAPFLIPTPDGTQLADFYNAG